MKKLYKSIVFILLLIFVLCNIGIAQTDRQRTLDLQEGIEKEELIRKFVKIIADGFSTCIPVYVSSDSYNGYVILSGNDLFWYYREVLDSIPLQKSSMKDYYIFATNFLLNKDTIKLASKEMLKSWEYHKFSIVDSIINYPEEKKQELIELAFDENGYIREESGSGHTLYQQGSLILKLFEWGILVASGGIPLTYALFDYTPFDGRIGSEPADMINDCMIKFLEHINPQSDDIYVFTDGYQYCFGFRHDEELRKENIKYITYEELRNQKSDTIFSELLKHGIRTVDYRGIFLENDLLIISFYENIIFTNEEGRLAKYDPEIQGNFIYLYFPSKKKWNFVEAEYKEHPTLCE